MRPLLPVLLLGALAFADGVDRAKLVRHVETLASRAYGGRSGKGARKAEAYVAAAFRAAGLKTQVREHPGVSDGEPCRNVVGVLQAGAKPAAEHVICSAHYDHLGGSGVLFYPGAADNAAGVAAMLEVARLLKARPGRDVIFIGFDQEEVGLVGSDAYAKRPLRPLEQCVAFVTFDILGRELADAVKGTLFCVGTERSDAALLDVVRGAARPDGLTIAYAGADIVGRRSDYVAFQERSVPFLFFSAGEYGDYHRPTDTAARLDFSKLEKETRLLVDVMRRLLAAPRPRFLPKPVARIDEVASLRAVVTELLAKPERLGMAQADIVGGRILEAQLRQLERLGSVTDEQRAMVVRTCRELMRRLQAAAR